MTPDNTQLIVNVVTQMEAGGAQKAAINVARRLRDRGFSSEVWFLYKKRSSYVAYDNVRWLCDSRPTGVGGLLKLIGALYKAFRDAQPAAVITYTHYANVIGQSLACAARVRYRLATQRSLSWSYPRLARWSDLVLGSLGVYTGNIFVSRTTMQSFASYPSTYLARTAVILNGLEVPEPSGGKQELRKRMGIPAESIVVANVGRIAYEKNQTLLIESFRELPDERIVLVVAGDGEWRSRLEQKVLDAGLSERVWLLGEVPPGQVYDVMAMADIFAFPSRYEGFGFALVEAMMLGLPLLVSDTEAHREIVGEAGVFLPVDNAEAWREAIVQLAKDADLRRQLSREAKERAALYDLDRMVDGYIEALFR